MRVVGVDISTVSLGFAVAEYNGNTGNPDLVSLDRLEFARSVPHKERRRQIRARVRQYVADHEPVMILLESVRLYHGQKMNPDVTLRLGSIMYTIRDATKCPVFSINPASWRKIVIGNGRAGKKESLKFARKLASTVKSHDVADAICLAYCGCVAKLHQFTVVD